MDSNEFVKLISSPLMNLDHTYRYSGTKLAEAESLSQHIMDTIMLGIKIIDEINARSLGEENLSAESYIVRAVYHDLEEVITGDIPRPLKYHNQSTIESMRDVADEVAERLFRENFNSDSWKQHYELWRDAKSGKEGFILKIVDNLVVINKVIKEISLLNNYYMIRVGYEVIQYTGEILDHLTDDDVIETWSDTTLDYLRYLLIDAVNAVEDILNSHKSIYDFQSHSMK